MGDGNWETIKTKSAPEWKRKVYNAAEKIE